MAFGHQTVQGEPGIPSSVEEKLFVECCGFVNFLE